MEFSKGMRERGGLGKRGVVTPRTNPPVLYFRYFRSLESTFSKVIGSVKLEPSIALHNFSFEHAFITCFLWNSFQPTCRPSLVTWPVSEPRGKKNFEQKSSRRSVGSFPLLLRKKFVQFTFFSTCINVNFNIHFPPWIFINSVWNLISDSRLLLLLRVIAPPPWLTPRKADKQWNRGKIMLEIREPRTRVVATRIFSSLYIVVDIIVLRWIFEKKFSNYSQLVPSPTFCKEKAIGKVAADP